MPFVTGFVQEEALELRKEQLSHGKHEQADDCAVAVDEVADNVFVAELEPVADRHEPEVDVEEGKLNQG